MAIDKSPAIDLNSLLITPLHRRKGAPRQLSSRNCPAPLQLPQASQGCSVFPKWTVSLCYRMTLPPSLIQAMKVYRGHPRLACAGLEDPQSPRPRVCTIRASQNLYRTSRRSVKHMLVVRLEVSEPQCLCEFQHGVIISLCTCVKDTSLQRPETLPPNSSLSTLWKDSDPKHSLAIRMRC